jgi:predicted RNA-binding protein with PIN domain
MPVPPAAVPAIVRGLGAYMRAVPALELPAEVRRLRNFHQKMLMAHADEIVALLEDETVRALVLQWLDDGGHGLPRKGERALRLAAERSEGWEDELEAAAGEARPPRRGPPSEKLEDALRREADRTAAAKEEARRVKEAARRSVVEERAATRELRKELDATRRALEAGAAEAERARGDAERARADLEKAERKATKDVAAAKAAQQEAAGQLRATRKELNAARRRISELEAALERTAQPKAARAPVRAPGGPRRRLPVPAGRLEDDPSTLAAWLDAPGVHLLVDGYNVAKAPSGFPDLDLQSQRERLVEGLERLTLRKKVPTTVVFDGSDVGPGTARLARTRVRIEYSRSGETADDHLVAKLAALPPRPVVLATSDRELQDRAEAEGATIATAAQLLELLR